VTTSGEWVSVSVPYLRPRSPGEPDAWSEETAQQGRTGKQRLREVAEVVPPLSVAQALNSPSGETVVVRRRVVLLDEQPVELTDSYYPASVARGTRLAQPRKIPGGAITLLAELGYRPHQVHEDVSARPPNAEEQQLLALRHDEWVLVLSRLVMTDSRLPIEASVMTMTANGRHLRYQLTV
jgi:GntR family transcriptional regulator